MIKTTDISWAAGIIDGEGSIFIRSAKHWAGLVIRVGMTHLPTLKKLQSLFGGNIGNAYRSKKNISHKDLYTWEVNSTNQINCLEKLYPYLITKQNQARIALEYLKLPKTINDSKGVPLDIMNQRLHYRLALQLAK